MQTFARDFPELVTTIAHTLHPTDVATLARVCHTMHDALVRAHTLTPRVHFRNQRRVMCQLHETVEYMDPRTVCVYRQYHCRQNPSHSMSESFARLRWRGCVSYYGLFRQTVSDSFVKIFTVNDNARVLSNVQLVHGLAVTRIVLTTNWLDLLELQYMWAFGDVSFGHIMQISSIAKNVFVWLSARDLCALELANTVFRRITLSYSIRRTMV